MTVTGKFRLPIDLLNFPVTVMSHALKIRNVNDPLKTVHLSKYATQYQMQIVSINLEIYHQL